MRLLSSSFVLAICATSFLVVFQNCSGFNANPEFNAASSLANLAPSGPNVVSLSIGSACVDANTPCIDVTICVPGTNQCQTISNVEVLTDDTFVGLRIFSSALSVSLPQEVDSSGNKIAECAEVWNNAIFWGPIATADVTLGGETVSKLPIQLIDSTYPNMPSQCSTNGSAVDTPANWGFNGVLSLGPAATDCGPVDCPQSKGGTVTYYTYAGCTGSACSFENLPVNQQVANPIMLLPSDNNGFVISLPAITNDQAAQENGYLILGVGTQANNTPPQAINVFPASTTTLGEMSIQMLYGGQTYATIVALEDSVNALPNDASITACSSSGSFSGMFCPTSEASMTIQVQGVNNTTSAPVSVTLPIGNASTEWISGNAKFALDDIALVNASYSASQNPMYLGVPFYIGRTIYQVYPNANSSLGTGPLWAW